MAPSARAPHTAVTTCDPSPRFGVLQSAPEPALFSTRTNRDLTLTQIGRHLLFFAFPDEAPVSRILLSTPNIALSLHFFIDWHRSILGVNLREINIIGPHLRYAIKSSKMTSAFIELLFHDHHCLVFFNNDYVCKLFLTSEQCNDIITLSEPDSILSQSAISMFDSQSSVSTVRDFRAFARQRTSSAPAGAARNLVGCVDACSDLTITGWVSSLSGGANIVMKLCVNGRQRQIRPVLYSRYQSAESPYQSVFIQKFEIDIPVDIWDVAYGKAFELSVYANDHLLTGNMVVITRDDIIATLIRGLSGAHSGPDGQHRALLALGHIQRGRLWSRLDTASRVLAAKIAREFSVDSVCFDVAMDTREPPSISDEVKSSPFEEKTVADQVTQSERNASTLKIALYDVNSLLHERGSVFPVVITTLHRHGLVGMLGVEFLLQMIPLLAQHDELPMLFSILEPSVVMMKIPQEGSWNLSLVTALFAAQDEFARMGNSLNQLVIQNTSSPQWFCIEAVSYAAQRFVERNRDIGLLGSCCHWFIELITTLGNGWYSRVYNNDIVKLEHVLISITPRMPLWYENSITLHALAHFGLNPVFWSLYENLGAKETSVRIVVLDKAYSRYCALMALVRDMIEDRQVDYLEIARLITWFRSNRVAECDVMLREMVSFAIQKLNSIDEAQNDLKFLITTYSDVRAEERLRLVAHPFGGFLSQDNESINLQLRKIWDQIGVNCVSEQRSSLANKERIFGEILLAANIFSDGGEEDVDAAWRADSATRVAAKVLDIWQSANRSIPEAVAVGLDIMSLAYGYLPCGDRLQRALAAAISEAQTELDKLCGPRQAPAAAVAARFRVAAFGGSAAADPGAAATNYREIDPLGDTLVVVYSCQKNLATRIEAIRNTWLKDLDRWRIHYVIVVGGGAGNIDGDVLSLNINDDYEYLPMKTLELLKWVANSTDYVFIIKIDDDCFLNIDEYFGSARYREFHYFGRKLSRGIGGTDRLWHQSKSNSEYARMTFDTSPEPSIYADGGGGYSLSRFAFESLLKQAETQEGRRLISRSYMEDKLVGDLLSLAGIACSDAGYVTYQRRRTGSSAIPIGRWENTFFPSRNSIISLVHLDDHRQQELVFRRRASAELWPKKIWPTHSHASVGVDANQLELLTGVDKARRLLRENIAVVCVLRNEKVMVRHFLAHYRSLGVKCFCFVDNVSDDGTLELLLGQDDVVLYSADTQYRMSHYGVDWQQAVLANHFLGKWAVVADADELLVFEGWTKTSLSEALERISEEGADAAQVLMVDMYPEGPLSSADLTEADPFEVAPWYDKIPFRQVHLHRGVFGDGPTVTSNARHRVDPTSPPHAFTTNKYAIIKYNPGVRLSEGLHSATNLRVSSKIFWFAHFKYHSGLATKVAEEVRRGQHFGNAAEYRRYESLLKTYEAGIWREGVSAKFDRYVDVDLFQAQTTDLSQNVMPFALG